MNSYWRQWLAACGIVLAVCGWAEAQTPPPEPQPGGHVYYAGTEEELAAALENGNSFARSSPALSPADHNARVVITADILLTQKLPEINSNLIIDGMGRTITRVDSRTEEIATEAGDGFLLSFFKVIHGLENNRIFFFNSGHTVVRNLSLKGGRITGRAGYAGAGAGAGMGAAVFVNEGAEVDFHACAFEDNHAVGGSAVRGYAPGEKAAGEARGLQERREIAIVENFARRLFDGGPEKAGNVRIGHSGSRGTPGRDGVDGRSGLNGTNATEIFGFGGRGAFGAAGQWGQRGSAGADGHWGVEASGTESSAAVAFTSTAGLVYFAAGPGGDGGRGGEGGAGGEGGRGGFGGGGGPGNKGGRGGKGAPGGNSGLNLKVDILMAPDDKIKVAGPGYNGNSGGGGRGGDGGAGGFGAGGGAGALGGSGMAKFSYADGPDPVGWLRSEGLTYNANPISRKTFVVYEPNSPAVQTITLCEKTVRGYSASTPLIGMRSSDHRMLFPSEMLSCDSVYATLPLVTEGASGDIGASGVPGRSIFGGGEGGTGMDAALNQPLGGGGAGMGGAVFIRPGAWVTIRKSLFLGNQASGGTGANPGQGLGGAIFNMGNLEMDNSTLSQNIAQNDGGAVFHYSGEHLAGQTNLARSSIRFVTIAHNEAQAGAGGGIAKRGEGISLGGNIIALNAASDTSAVDLAGAGYGNDNAAGFGYNLVGQASSAEVMSLPVQGDQIGVDSAIDPLLYPLADNNGPTRTHAPHFASPARNAWTGAPAALLAGTDQRLLPRLAGSSADLGAVEYDPLSMQPSQEHLELAVANAPDGGVLDISEWGGHIVTLTNFTVAKSITLDASAAAQPVVFDGGGTSRIFDVVAPDAEARLTLRGVRLQNGQADQGGAVRVSGKGRALLEDCVLENNTAGQGGAIYVSGSGAGVSLLRVALHANSATEHGGAVAASGLASFEAGISTFYENSAPAGGGLHLQNAAAEGVEIVTSTFSDNAGGAVYAASPAWFRHVTINEPGRIALQAATAAGVIHLTHTIIVGEPTVARLDGGLVDISSGYNVFTDFGGFDVIAGDGNKFISDPELLPLMSVPGRPPAHPLALTSRARDRGNPFIENPPAEDQFGAPRVRDAEVPGDGFAMIDIGAVEASSRVFFVKHDAAGENNGGAWHNAFTDLNSALVQAVNGDVVLVAEGVYRPQLNSGDPRLAAVGAALAAGVDLRGGYAGSEGLMDPPPAGRYSVLSGDVDQNDTGVANGVTSDASGIAGANSRTVLLHQSAPGLTTKVRGFIITGGNANNLASATSEDSRRHAVGGGLFHDGEGSLELQDVIFQGNQAFAGGGAFIDAAPGNSVSLENARFQGNRDIQGSGFSFTPAESGGAGLYARGNVSFYRVTFAENIALGLGGGLRWANGGSAVRADSMAFLDNKALDGGGLYLEDTEARFRNGIFSRNSASRFGGAMLTTEGSPALQNCTFSRNSLSSPLSAGGLQIGIPGAPGSGFTQIRNCIFWNNSSGRARLAEQQFFADPENYMVNDTIIQGDDGGLPSPGRFLSGNPLIGHAPTDYNPLFYEDLTGIGFGARHDLRLFGDTEPLSRSAAIDRALGVNVSGLAEDYLGRQRVVAADPGAFTPADLGAHEYQAPPRLLSVTPADRAEHEPASWILTFNETVTGVDAEDFLRVLGPEDPPVIPRALYVSQENNFATQWRVTLADFEGEGQIGLDWNASVTIADITGRALEPHGSLGASLRVVDFPPVVTISGPDRAATRGETVTFPVRISHASALAADPASYLQITRTGDVNFQAQVSGSLPDLTVAFQNFSGGGSFKFSFAAGLAEDAESNLSSASSESVEVIVAVNSVISISPPSLSVTHRGPIRFHASYNHGGDVRLAPEHVRVLATGTAEATARIEGGSSGQPVIFLENISGEGSLAISIAGASAEDPAGNSYPDSSVSASAQITGAVSGRVYVSAGASGANNGGSWTDAFNSLEEALSRAGANTEIWVAAGVYRAGSSSPDDAFIIGAGTKVYGGFAGHETDLSERPADVFAQPSILSGDRLGNDSQAPVVTDASTVTQQADNARNVVLLHHADDETILDGFIITAGKGGVIGEGEGGASGAGLYLRESAGQLRHLRITGNSAEKDGGGIFAYYSSVSLTSVTVAGNFAGRDGGGAAALGGTLRLDSVEIHSNRAAGVGGGLKAAEGTALLNRVSVRGNRSLNHGGGAAAFSGIFAARNSVFAGNLASPETPAIGYGSGGALFLSAGTDCELVNCTVAGNRANANAGSIYVGAQAGLGVYNSIIQDNEGMFDVYPEPGVQHVRIRRSLTLSVLAFTDPIDWSESIWEGPQFVAPVSGLDAPTLAGDLRLQAGSPAIDAGTNTLVFSSLDLDGSARIFDGNLDSAASVDMGAYERKEQRPPAPPQISQQQVSEGLPAGSVVGALSAVDPNAGDSVVFTLASGAGGEDNAAFAIVGNELRTAAVFDFEVRQQYAILVRATDSTGLFSERAFAINIIDIGETPPVALDDRFSGFMTSQNIDGNVIDSVEGPDTDPDGDSLTVAALNGEAASIDSQVALPGGALLTLRADGSFSYLGNNRFASLRPGETGTDAFQYTITDGNGNFATATATVSVRGANDRPQPQADMVERVSGSTLKIRASALLRNDSDPDGDTLYVLFNTSDDPLSGFPLSAGTSARGATLRSEDGWVYYSFLLTPDPGEPDTFSYYVKDPGGLFDRATVTVNIVNLPFLLQMTGAPATTYDSGADATDITAHFIGVPGRTYRVEASSSVGDAGSWAPAGVATAGALGNFSVTETNLPGNVAQRFYRASLQ